MKFNLPKYTYAVRDLLHPHDGQTIRVADDNTIQTFDSSSGLWRLSDGRQAALPLTNQIAALGSTVKAWLKCRDALGSISLANAAGTAADLLGDWGLELPGLSGEPSAKSIGGGGTGAVIPYAQLVSAELPAALPWTLFYLFMPYSSNAFNPVGDDGYGFLAVGQSSEATKVQIRQSSAQVAASTFGVIRVGQTHLMELSVDAAGNARAYVDGVLRVGPVALDPGTVGPGAGSSGSNFLIGTGGAGAVNGAFAELVVMDSLLTATQRANLNAAVPR
jgi:hypothetical protein